MTGYDYIFAGTGLAGLMVLHEMNKSGVLSGKSVLLLDPEEKDKNDRTWCFWENGAGEWDSVVAKQWFSGFFVNRELRKECFGSGMSYKMIESQSFYNRIFDELKSFPDIVWKQERLLSFVESDLEVIITTDVNTYSGSVFFNSVLDAETLRNKKKYPLLLQHFQGWFVKTSVPFFNHDSATFMDFSVPQNGNTRFMYVLPISDTEALVEYTLFSADVLADAEYENAIAVYLKEKGIADYEIVRKEKGVIPMTTYPFWKGNSKRILHIGSAGGWTKASTGYTFKNSVKQSKRVAAYLKSNPVDFTHFYKPNRFTFYDSLFVDVLYGENQLGCKLFSGMFTKVQPKLVFDFLDEKTSWKEEMKVIWSCPKLPFLKVLLFRLFRF
ncbi:crtY protein [Flavobacterium limnosediminis JC2902]|uniref:CrtY protein n=1 Tax=Flavobacterium limnosediminis JC2902 TaxID=1341181 RepID=V6SRI8_9FLAO|nr:lycopene cyclase family protein [Flavobacterium limnosediminis]ESU27040.1 crtY protein [Flavobacterium limnosediminis JC2902]